MTRTLTILGCGSSGGVPRVGGDWGECDPAEPRNRRRRCSVLLRQSTVDGDTTVLIDTSPDMREQMLAADVRHLDGVWYSHEHADHTHGIDELRGYFLRQKKRIPVWADKETATMLMRRFGYCFESQPGSGYPAVLDLHPVHHGRPVETLGAGGALSGLPFPVRHGTLAALGFRVGGLAYTPDIDGMTELALEALTDLDVWIVDALRRVPHPSHFSLPQTLQWIEKLKPRRAIITNMHVDMDYQTLKAELPINVEPAYDGMTVTF